MRCLNKEQQSVVQTLVLDNNTDVKPFINFDRFSDFSKLVKSVGFVFKFINKCKKVNNDENYQAKVYLLQIMQKQSFPEELEFLKNSKLFKTVPDLVNNLNLFLDSNNLIRTKGRISKSHKLDFDLANPILLPKFHDLSKLIIKYSHLSCKHLGISATLTKLRMLGFWLIMGRQNVKSVISNCFVCKKFNSICFKYPKLTNLPSYRVNLVRPFTDTGVDYTGHLYVKVDDKTCKKFYLLIFTCLNIRAVHIELIPDQSTYSFVQALIRFSNIFGVPDRVYSDNAKSFCAALGSNIIEHHLESTEFKNKFQVNQIKHIKIPLYSPWIGATWERMIRTIKSCLYKSLGRSKVEFYDLLTTLSDIQLAINSRPLTYRCSSDSTLDIISPNCF